MALTGFSKTNGETATQGEVTTLLGRGSEFEGKLSFEGTVRIDGKFSGEIFSDDVLIIGDGAEVRAELSVGSVIIHGNVFGNIKAARAVEIHAPGRVKGNITTPALFMEKGVLFDGSCHMESAEGAGAGGGLTMGGRRPGRGEPSEGSETEG